MADENLSEIDKMVKIGRSLGVFNDWLGRKLLELHADGFLDSWSIGQINSRVQGRLREEAFRDIPFKPPQLHSGDMTIGTDEKGRQIMSFVQSMNAGTLLIGNTGSGKTTLIIYYVLQIARLLAGMWLVDIRKKEFRMLLPWFVDMGIDLVIVRGRKFRINPLEVSLYTDPYEYAATITDVFIKTLNLPQRASVLLSSAIIKLYKQFNVFGGNTQRYPTLFHLFEAVRIDKDANSQARQAVLDNLELILLAFGTEMLGYYKGWPVHELAKHHMVFELTGQPESGKDMTLNYHVAAEFISRVSRGISNKKMDLWISCDESQRMFSQDKETGGHGGNSFTDLAGVVRGEGAGLCISALTPENLSKRAASITSTHIMGRCGSSDEYEAAGKFLGLSGEQISWCVHHMKPGRFVGQLADGNWRHPFLFTIPNTYSLKPVTDEEADDTLKALDYLHVEPVEFSKWSPVQCVEISDNKTNATPDAPLPDNEYRLLKAIVDNPMLPSSQYIKFARISPNTLKKLRGSLIEKGFIKEHEVDMSGRGRGKRLWEPLEAGKQAVANESI